MNIRPRTTNIPPLTSDDASKEFEVRLAKGPIAIGEPGNGTYAELYSKDYLAFLDETTSRLRLFVSTGTEWQEVDDTLFPQPPHPVDEIRHIGVCFDQAARLVLAYERDEEVFVYQWDPATQTYIVRGPFPGVDPVLIHDAAIGFYPPDSDVLLFHLSVDRRNVYMRVQRELYDPPRLVASFEEPVILDQAVALPYVGELVGSLVRNPEATGFAILTDVYPIYLSDQAGSVSVSPPGDWVLIPVVIVYDAGTDSEAVRASVAPPVNWDFIPIVVVLDVGTEIAASASVSPPLGWNYIPVVIIYDGGTEIAASASVSPPTAWNYALVVVVYNGGMDVAASASVSPPVEWDYFV